jgi:IS5 family transposase
MPQPGFFDLDDRYAKLDGIGDPLVKIKEAVDWEGFRPILNEALAKPRKSNAGRKEYDRVLMFKITVLQHLYNLGDDQTEYQIRDRYSFSRFLDLTPEDEVPDAKTLWRYKEGLKSAQVFDRLFDELLGQIAAEGYVARKGQIVDASLVAAPRQRNSREENARIKQGEVPEDWSEAKRRQKDVEARWTQKNGVNHYGYKNHVSVDREHKVIRRWQVSDAAMHDSQVFEELLDETNTSAEVWADSAYRSADKEAALKEDGWRSRIHRKGQKDKPLNAREQQANRKRSQVRARVEHVFAQQEAMGGMVVRIIGIVRARLKIGMKNLVYNIRRLAWLKENCRPAVG